MVWVNTKVWYEKLSVKGRKQYITDSVYFVFENKMGESENARNES